MTTRKHLPLLCAPQVVRNFLNQTPNVWPAKAIDLTEPMQSQDRRPIKHQPNAEDISVAHILCGGKLHYRRPWDHSDVSEAQRLINAGRAKNYEVVSGREYTARNSPAKVGDVFYVREAFTVLNYVEAISFVWDKAYIENSKHINSFLLRDAMANGFQPTLAFKADGKHADLKFNPSLHMPQWASRIHLEVMRVRVERACDISEEDAIAEGMMISGRTGLFPSPAGNCITADMAFEHLWKSLYGPEKWQAFCWVYDLQRIK
jgi:hypothetical protein